MPSYGPDCKRLKDQSLCEQFKTENCKIPLYIAKKYRRFETRTDIRPLRDQALSEIPEWDKKYATDTIRLINSSGPGSNRPGPNSQLLGESSSSGSSGVQCCGPEYGDADLQRIVSKIKVFEYRSPAENGPTQPRTYKFGYRGMDRRMCDSLCQEALNRLEDWANNPANRNHPQHESTVSFIYRISYQVSVARSNPSLYEGLFRSLQISGGIPLMSKTHDVVDNEPTFDYTVNQNWELEYQTSFKCRDNRDLGIPNYAFDENRACCRCNCSSSSSSGCFECDETSDCPQNQICQPYPGQIARGCCVDDCREPCSQPSECEGYPLAPNGQLVTCRQGCCWVGNCRWGGWSPNSNEIDCGVNFTQTRILLEGSLEECTPETREWTGTKDCCKGPCQTDLDCENLGEGYYCWEDDETGELCCRQNNSSSSSISGQASLGLITKSYLGLGLDIDQLLNSDMILPSEINNTLERIKKEI